MTAPPGEPLRWQADVRTGLLDIESNAAAVMMDEKGRIWITARVRPPANPDFCKKGSDHPSAKVLPLEEANRHLSMYDPATGTFTLISTCFPTHHLNFATDANQTLWTSAGGPQTPVVGWLNRKMFEETGAEKSDDYVEPDQPVDPTKDKRVVAGLYSVSVNPVDGTIWGTSLGSPGY